jgi:hypothetical protein
VRLIGLAAQANPILQKEEKIVALLAGKGAPLVSGWGVIVGADVH